MATNPTIQAVLLFQHHQTTTPFMPVPGVPPALTSTATEPVPKTTPEKETMTPDPPPFDTVEEENDDDSDDDGTANRYGDHPCHTVGRCRDPEER